MKIKLKKIVDLSLTLVGSSISNELPFIVSFMLLMGSVEVFQRMHGLMVSPDASTSMLDLAKHIGLWFFMSFVVAVIINISRRKGLLRICLYGVVLFFYIIQKFLFLNFGTNITPTILTMIAETNSQETKDFVASYLFRSNSLDICYNFVFVILLLFLFEFLYSKFLRGRVIDYKRIIGFIFFPPLLFGIYSCQVYRPFLSDISTDAMRVQTGHISPQDPFTCLIRSVCLLHMSSKETDKAVNCTLNMSPPSYIGNDDSLRVILVIGESYIKHHASVYGYPHETTPRLKQMQEKGNLFVFNDVVTPYNSTSRVLKNILSCNSIGDNQSWYNYPYLPAIFKKAGYDVFLWDNQHNADALADFAFTLDSYMYNSVLHRVSYSKCNELSFSQDLPLVESYEQEVAKFPSNRLFTIFHLQGQHVDAKSRFPHEKLFRRFTQDSIFSQATFLTAEKKQRIADYDNATYYNDSVICRIVNIFKNDNAVLLYLSDHGDEVYDYRDQYGREHNPHLTDSCAYYEFEIPFMIWCSDKYRLSHPIIIEQLTHSIAKPFMSDNICQILFTIGSISTKYYHAERDILNPLYKCPPRILQDRINFDKLMDRP